MNKRTFENIQAHFSSMTLVLLDIITSINCLRRLLEYIPRPALAMVFDRISAKTVEQKSLRRKNGSVAIVSQSGAMEIIVSSLLKTENLGVSRLVSFDNGEDIDESRFLRLAGDQETKVILLCIEGTQRGRPLMDVAKIITRKKPIVVFKAGKIGAAANAVLSHTGFMAGRHEIWSAAFKQSGMLQADTIEEMLDFVNALSLQKPAKGRRIGIVTNGGGAGIVCADACVRLGLEVPSLPEATRQSLKKRLAAFSETTNPVDVTVAANAKDYSSAFNALIESESINVVIMMIYPTPILRVEKVFGLIAEQIENSSKPIIASTSGDPSFVNSIKFLTRNKIPLYILPERAAAGAAALVRYGRVTTGYTKRTREVCSG